MIEFRQYYGQWQGVKGHWSGLPSWARTIVGIFAIPGLVLAVLSILVFLVSILALLIFTVPVYSVLKSITRTASVPVNEQPAGVKRVESTIVE